MIDARTGRRVLLAVVLGGFFVAFLVQFLLGRDGAASEETSHIVVERILKIFVPLLGIFAAFYFSERGEPESGQRRKTSIEGFIFAFVAVTVWVALPTVALIIMATFDGAIRLLDSFEMFGTSIAVAALTYYFSTSAPNRLSER
jgi:hypothetical protein